MPVVLRAPVTPDGFSAQPSGWGAGRDQPRGLCAACLRLSSRGLQAGVASRGWTVGSGQWGSPRSSSGAVCGRRTCALCPPWAAAWAPQRPPGAAWAGLGSAVASHVALGLQATQPRASCLHPPTPPSQGAWGRSRAQSPPGGRRTRARRQPQQEGLGGGGAASVPSVLPALPPHGAGAEEALPGLPGGDHRLPQSHCPALSLLRVSGGRGGGTEDL